MTPCELRSNLKKKLQNNGGVCKPLSEKELPAEEPIKESPEPKKKEKEPPVTEEEVDEEIEEPQEEKPKRKKGKKRAKLTVLQAVVLETIRDSPQRPRAIQTIIRGTGGVNIPRNDIIRSLNELKNKGLVEKVTTKAWQAI